MEEINIIQPAITMETLFIRLKFLGEIIWHKLIPPITSESLKIEGAFNYFILLIFHIFR